jgi:CBS domain containing-hemolysin-like protein
MDILTLIGLLSIPLFVLMNGLFVAAEFALVAVRKTRVEELVQQGRSGAGAVNLAVTNLDRTIAATQLGITLASIALGWMGEPALAHLLGPLFQALPGGWKAVTTHTIASGVAFFLITFLHVVFGELIPKTVALQIPDRAALWIATPLVWFATLARPLIFLMNGTGNAILRLAGFPPATGREMVHSIDELALLIEDTEEAGILGETQAEVVQKVFRLSDVVVRDCMIPVDRMDALEVKTPPEKALAAVLEGRHTRMPVYEGQRDNVVGIVNSKDLFYLVSLQEMVVLDDALYPPVFVDGNERVTKVLDMFLDARRHMAIVRDAAGKVAGLITLEDILEQIVGEIEDEHDA